jgi:hypothetical protein
VAGAAELGAEEGERVGAQRERGCPIVLHHFGAFAHRPQRDRRLGAMLRNIGCSKER